jgi:FlaA1/EpsC-like NDP-sugar epimerase
MIAAVDIHQAAAAVTGRSTSLFAAPMEEMASEFDRLYPGARILVTGGAGFIAGQTLRTILPWEPARLVVVDTNENALAELVRDLRISSAVPAGTDLAPRLVDATSPLLQRLVQDEGPFDVVLAFAAAKHVRSERDAVSALHMLNVNINGTTNAVDAVVDTNPEARVFVVSTDKAADPASIMGASKRLMELAVFARHPAATTARFANVAFSAGSLLESWLVRMGRRQILPVPADTERYFVTPRESGQLCALAAAAPAGSIVVPDHAAISPTELQDALERLLTSLGFQAEISTGNDPSAARPGESSYPVLVTPRDTPGEKQTEVFCGSDETLVPWITNLDHVLAPVDAGPAARELGVWVRGAIQNPLSERPSLAQIVTVMAEVLPNMQHVAGSGGLDQRI